MTSYESVKKFRQFRVSLVKISLASRTNHIHTYMYICTYICMYLYAYTYVCLPKVFSPDERGSCFCFCFCFCCWTVELTTTRQPWHKWMRKSKDEQGEAANCNWSAGGVAVITTTLPSKQTSQHIQFRMWAVASSEWLPGLNSFA